ncbi:Aspartate/ornithine carbamoyltransferase [Pisolithus thermaeus]|nr:Aspartate/ornithine carbamoyltransferase [Pisolithus thermaeus]
MSAVPHLMSLADLTAPQILRIVNHAHYLKQVSLPWLAPQSSSKKSPRLRMPSQSLFNKSVALLFSKRSTRTRVSAETAASPRDTARVIGGMCQGIFARVGAHEEIEELARYSPVPVLNALSSLWHPTQTLADVLTLHEHAHLFDTSLQIPPLANKPLPPLRPLTVAYVDARRISPKPAYQCPKPVWDRVTQLGCDKDVWWGSDPKEAVKGADVVVTDTWISMGQEAEKAQRLQDFAGYQVTEALCRDANPDWKFLHCLPRKQEEVDDEVTRIPESDNRKWTIMAAFDLLFGKWDLAGEKTLKIIRE